MVQLANIYAGVADAVIHSESGYLSLANDIEALA
jgi:hypothetical protein|tara:strand:- start:112 stop:213 length:102 start_codon:yes stop_codon:yes gene_type:complete